MNEQSAKNNLEGIVIPRDSLVKPWVQDVDNIETAMQLLGIYNTDPDKPSNMVYVIGKAKKEGFGIYRTRKDCAVDCLFC